MLNIINRKHLLSTANASFIFSDPNPNPKTEVIQCEV